MLDELRYKLYVEKRAFQISFTLAKDYGIVLTGDHPKFKEAVEFISKQVQMGILGNRPIVNMLVLMIKG